MTWWRHFREQAANILRPVEELQLHSNKNFVLTAVSACPTVHAPAEMPLRATLWSLMSQSKHSWAEPWVKVPLCKPNDFRQLHIFWRVKKKLKKTQNECYFELVVDATSIMTDLLHFNLLNRAEKGYIQNIYCTMYICTYYDNNLVIFFGFLFVFAQ